MDLIGSPSSIAAFTVNQEAPRRISNRSNRPSTTSSYFGSSFLKIGERFGMSSSSSLPLHTPSQSVTDEEGNKWRLCAGAAVFNSKNELLIGERLGKPGSWQTPQGGVDGGDKPETVSQAAIRELFEEVGLKHGQHVVIDEAAAAEGATDVKCRYRQKVLGAG